MKLEVFHVLDDETIDNSITKRNFLDFFINKQQIKMILIKILSFYSVKILNIIKSVMPAFSMKNQEKKV